MFQFSAEEERKVYLFTDQKRWDADAFAAAVSPLENKMYRVARSILRSSDDCADAIQEALLKAWLALPRLRDPALFEPWLMRIVQNESRNLLRRNRRARPDSLSPEEAESTPARQEDNTDGILRKALDGLEENQRLLLTLHHVLGYTIEEIARMQRMRQGTVKSRLSRARAALAGKLEELE